MRFRTFLLRAGRRSSLLLLLLSIGATVAAAVQVARTVRSQKVVVQSVKQGYSEFVAWSYEQHLSQSMQNAAGEVLGPVNHGEGMHSQPRIPHASDLIHYLPWDEKCYCHVTRRGPSPVLLWAFSLGSDTVGIGLNWHRPPDEGWLGDPNTHSNGDGVPVAASKFGAKYAWINDTVSAMVRSGFVPRNGYVWITAHRPEGVQYLSYRTMPTTWGETVVYGAQYDSAAFTSMLRNTLDQQDLLPQAFTKQGENRKVIAVEVTDASQRRLFQSRDQVRWQFVAHHIMPEEKGSLEIKTMIDPAAANAMIIGGTPRSRLPFLFVLLGLAVAFVLVALAQIARESELARAREGFVSSISHELRTPVAQIRLYLETLRLGRVDDDATRDWSLANIDRETQRLSNLVDNVLRFSRSKGQIVAAPATRIDIAAETRSLVEEFRPLAASNKASIALHQHDGDSHAWLSSDALRHILLNLLDNAVKYGPAGQTISVDVIPNGETTRIVVSDEGTGVPQTQRHSIFEPFSRGDSRATRAAGGSGIGLTIVRDLVKANGGSIRVDDAAGGGAAFTVELPKHHNGDHVT
jgi:signal transduction histidine kinase